MDSKINLICCNTLEEWHNWLKENHLKEKSIGIIINKKHTGKGTISHLDSMKEAICFGWIDTTIKRLDENKYIRHFRRRTDKSTWSENTLGYAKELLEQNRLYPEGLKRYKEGLAKPVLDHGIPKNPNTPKDVKNEIRLTIGNLDKWKKLKNSIISNGLILYGKFEEMPEEAQHKTLFAWENIRPESKRVMLIKRMFGYS